MELRFREMVDLFEDRLTKRMTTLFGNHNKGNPVPRNNYHRTTSDVKDVFDEEAPCRRRRTSDKFACHFELRLPDKFVPMSASKTKAVGLRGGSSQSTVISGWNPTSMNDSFIKDPEAGNADLSQSTVIEVGAKVDHLPSNVELMERTMGHHEHQDSAEGKIKEKAAMKLNEGTTFISSQVVDISTQSSLKNHEANYSGCYLETNIGSKIVLPEKLLCNLTGKAAEGSSCPEIAAMVIDEMPSCSVDVEDNMDMVPHDYTLEKIIPDVPFASLGHEYLAETICQENQISDVDTSSRHTHSQVNENPNGTVGDNIKLDDISNQKNDDWKAHGTTEKLMAPLKILIS